MVPPRLGARSHALPPHLLKDEYVKPEWKITRGKWRPLQPREGARRRPIRAATEAAIKALDAGR